MFRSLFIRLGVSILVCALIFASCGTKHKTPEIAPPPPAPSAITPLPSAKLWERPLKDSILQEMRAVWLTTTYGLDWPKAKADTPDGIRRQKEELERILDRLVEDGYNTVFFQARMSGTTSYDSPYEPYGRVFTTSGEAPGYDPLSFATEACHKRGLTIHAWIVTYPLVSNKQRPHPIVTKHPEWAIAHRGTRHLDPGNPSVRTYIARLAADIAKRYDVDGVHFDYFRYPEDAERFNDKKTFEKYGHGQSLEQWRRQNLTNQLAEIRELMNALRPEVQISVAPLGKYRKLADLGRPHGWTAYEFVHQDVEEWARRGLVDFVAPMMYYKDHLFEPFLIDWQRSVGKYIPIIVGLAPYRTDASERSPWQPEVIKEQIAIARNHGAAGIAMFRTEHIGPKYPLLRTYIQRAFSAKALPISLPRGKYLAPSTPRGLSLKVDQGQVLLSWVMPPNTEIGTTYRVWVTSLNSDGIEQSFLLAQGLPTTSFTLPLNQAPQGKSLEFGIEAVSALGVSTPCEVPAILERQSIKQ